MSIDEDYGDFLALSLSKTLSRQKSRRLSSLTVARDELYDGPAVVAPPQHMDHPSDAHQTALAMEMARIRLAAGSEWSTPTDTSGAVTPVAEEEESEQEQQGPKTTDRFAFAFDIDGVLIKGGEVIPEAIEAMKVLNGQNEYNIKV